MTSLEDKAEEADTRFVAVTNLNVGSIWRIESGELVDADDLGTDEFPRHGDWLEASHGGEVTYYLECPAGLASAILRPLEERGAESAEGYWFAVREKGRQREDDNAPWTFDLEVATSDVETKEDALEALRNE